MKAVANAKAKAKSQAEKDLERQARKERRQMRVLKDDLARNGLNKSKVSKSIKDHSGPWHRQELIEYSLEMVMQLAQEKQGRGLPFGDLFQEGCIGLIEAIDSKDLSYEPDPFSWLRSQVDNAMEQAIEIEATIRREAEMLLEEVSLFDHVETALKQELGREPKIKELAQELHWDVARVKKIREMVNFARDSFDEDILSYIQMLQGTEWFEHLNGWDEDNPTL